jgi:hypothetical protein
MSDDVHQAPVTSTGAGEAIGMPKLLELSHDELDDLFRRSPAGPIPNGETDGTLIAFPGTEFTEIAAKLAHLVAWKGKVFDREHGVLRNRITPFDLDAIQAKVAPGESWFDGQPCTVLDYSHTSLIAHWIRDEIRLVAPELYLGLVYWDRTRIAYFALRVPA